MQRGMAEQGAPHRGAWPSLPTNFWDAALLLSGTAEQLTREGSAGRAEHGGAVLRGGHSRGKHEFQFMKKFSLVAGKIVC